MVCDPVTGGHVRLPPIPSEFANVSFNGTVICAAGGEQGHVHGAYHSSPFKVVATAATIDRIPMVPFTMIVHVGVLNSSSPAPLSPMAFTAKFLLGARMRTRRFTWRPMATRVSFG